MKLAKELRKEYAFKLEDRNELLDKLRSSSSMTKDEKDAAWVCLSDLASCLAKRHYRRKQWCPKEAWYQPPNSYEEQDYYKHTERMMVVLEFLKGYLDDDINLVIARLKARVTWVELVLEARSLGINLELGDVKHAHTQPAIRDIVTASRIHKQIGLEKSLKEVVEHYAYTVYKTSNKFPTYQRLALFLSRYYQYQQSKSITTATLASDLPENFIENITGDSEGAWSD